MVSLLWVLICTLPAQPKIWPTEKELAQKISENYTTLKSSQNKVVMFPSKYRSYATKTRSWFKLLDEDFESGMPAGWTVINGDNDSFTWVVGTFYIVPPPNYGTAYCLYNDDAAGSYNISGDSIQAPALGIPDSITYIYLSYGYGHAEYEGESLKVEVRYHDGISWGDWQLLRAYGITASGTDTFILNENNDSLQVMWLYRDNHTYGHWGWGSSFDNVLIRYYIPVENDAGMFSINSPISNTAIGTTVQVNGTVKNYGIDTFSFESGVNIYDPDLLIAFTQTVQVDNLPPSDTLNIDFGSFQLTKSGTYTVEMFTYALEDTSSWNDSLTTTFNSAYCYWQRLPSAGIRSVEHAVVYDPVNDLFFIIGGDSTGYQTNMDICLSFDPKTNTWDTLEPMPTKRSRHCADYRNGFIDVVCGIDDGDKLNTHEVYDINQNTWSTKAPAPLTVTSTSAATWRDSLFYLIGGYDVNHEARTEVYFYDAPTNAWYAATSLPRPFFTGGLKIKGDSIFIIGGSDGGSYYSDILLGEINPADPTEIDWSWGVSLPMAYNAGDGLAIKDNRVYMIGGGGVTDGTNEVWEYDIRNETWDSLPDYPTSVINKVGFAERREGPDSSGVVYCFMGDTSSPGRTPTNECYRLIMIPSSSGIKEDEKPKENTISLNSIISTDKIIINCNIANRCDLKIYMYDVLGRQVFSYLVENISTGSHQLNLETNLANGIYFIRVEAGKAIASEKILLIR
jgi:N-acetylneuraminic acid mutarotase